MSAQERPRTGLDGDGIAKVGAVQLPGHAQLALRQHHVMLLHVLARSHRQQRAVQAHCTAKTLISTVACPVTVQGMLLHVSCQRTWPGARSPGSLHRQRPPAALPGFPSHLISGVLVHVLDGRHGQACAVLAHCISITDDCFSHSDDRCPLIR